MSDEVIRVQIPDLSLAFDLPDGRCWRLAEPLRLVMASAKAQQEALATDEPDEYGLLRLLPKAVADFGAPADLSAAELLAVLTHVLENQARRDQEHLDRMRELSRDGSDAGELSATWLPHGLQR